MVLKKTVLWLVLKHWINYNNNKLIKVKLVSHFQMSKSTLRVIWDDLGDNLQWLPAKGNVIEIYVGNFSAGFDFTM